MSESTVPRAERLRVQLREEIVRAAAAAFARGGYHRTAMADIARDVGIGQSSLYAQFSGKRALFDAVIDEAMGHVLALLTAENSPAASATFADYRAQATRIAAGFAALVHDDPTIVRLLRTLLVEARGVDDELAGKADAFTDAAAHVTAAYLRHGRDTGYLRADLDVDATARVVTALILAVALEQDRRDAPRADTERLVGAALRLYLDGIAASPAVAS